MRSLPLLFCVLLVAASHLAAQTSDNSSQYLVNQGYPILPPIVRTPIVSLSDQNAYGENRAQAGQEYWSVAPIISYVQAPSRESASGPLTPKVFNTGITEMVTLNDLHARGIGISLGEYAAYWKTHSARAARVYTNADIEHLKGSDVHR